MKSASTSLIALLDSQQFLWADLFTFTLSDGTFLRYTSADDDLTVTPNNFVNRMVYSDISENISANITFPHGFYFKTDGTKMYVIDNGFSNMRVVEYILSTPWLVSSATYNTFFNLDAQTTNALGIAFKSDGSKMYISGSVDPIIYEYVLSTPWLISSATFSTSFNVSAQISFPVNVTFKNDGSAMYISDMYISDGITIFEYILSTPWLVTSATYNTSLTINVLVPINISSFPFNADGSKMYVVDSYNASVYEYVLSTPWLISSATPNGINKILEFQDTSPIAVAFSADSTKMFMLGSITKTVYEYDLDLTPHLFSSVGPALTRGTTKSVIGVTVDQLKISFLVNSGILINSIPLAEFAMNGGFDGARLKLERVFMPTLGDTSAGALINFVGRVADLQSSRSQIDLNINSDLELLNIMLPKNLYQAGCIHSLYDTGCKLIASNFTVTGNTTANSTALAINCNLAQANTYFDLGTIHFTTGQNAGLTRSVESYTTGIMMPSLAFPFIPQAGDLFTAKPGCDKLAATCNSKYANLGNFRGYPTIPVPETAY